METFKSIEEQRVHMDNCDVCCKWLALPAGETVCWRCKVVREYAKDRPMLLVQALAEHAPERLPQPDRALQRTLDDLVKINKQLKADRDGYAKSFEALQKKYDCAERTLKTVGDMNEVVYDLPRAERLVELEEKLEEKEQTIEVLRARNITLQEYVDVNGRHCEGLIDKLKALQRLVEGGGNNQDPQAYNHNSDRWYQDSRLGVS